MVLVCSTFVLGWIQTIFVNIVDPQDRNFLMDVIGSFSQDLIKEAIRFTIFSRHLLVNLEKESKEIQPCLQIWIDSFSIFKEIQLFLQFWELRERFNSLQKEQNF